MKKGLFITFEGMDGAGKTTQIRLLKAHLEAKGHPVLLTREPGGTPISDRIRALILDVNNTGMDPMAELLLYYASRAQHIQEVILPSLKKGVTVICDRFYDSSYAYQQSGRAIDKAVLDRLNEMVVKDCRPDVTFLLDLPEAESESRLNSRGTQPDRLELENAAFRQRVRQGFLAQAAAEPDRIRVVDASGSVEEIFSSIAGTMEQML